MSGFSLWSVIPLEDLAEQIDYGLTASATDSGNGPKFLRITDIQNDRVDWATVPLCSCTIENREKYALKAGDIVFARTGATTGKSFLVRSCPLGTIFASYLIRVRPSANVDSGYLARYFQTPEYWHYVTRSSTGTAQAGVNASNLKKLPVPLPPIDEQRRIAAILNKADAVRRKRQQAIALTEELLRSAFLEMFGDPITNPKGWEIKTIEQICKITKLTGFEYTEHIKYQDSGEIIALRALNVKNGRLKLNEIKFIDRETSNFLKRSKLFKGDVVMTYIGVNIGDVAIIDKDDRYHLAPNIAKISPKPNVNSVYLMRCLEFNKSQLEKYTTNTAKQALNMGKIRDVKIPLPLLALQEKFASCIEQIQKSTVKHQNSLIESQTLFNSLLQRAFRGEL